MPITAYLSINSGRKLVLSHYAAGEECRAHRHSEVQHSLLLIGSYVELSMAGQHEIDGRTISFKPARFEHETRFGSSGTLILSLRHEPVAQSRQSYRLSVGLPAASAKSMMEGAVNHDAIPFSQTFKELDETRDVSAATPWLCEARQQLIDQPGLPVAALARSLGRHPVYMARQFRSVFGQPPSQVRQNDRTARAVNQIVRSSTSLVEIAGETGFSDQAHMTRSVKSATGWTPANLRRVLSS